MVEKVQNNTYLTTAEFKQLSKTEKKRYNSASDSERQQITQEIRGKKNPEVLTGTEVEHAKAPAPTEEQKAAKNETNSKKQKEIANMKAYAEKMGYEHTVLTAQEKLSPDSGTLIGNNKEFKDEVLQLLMDNDEIPTKGNVEIPTKESLIAKGYSEKEAENFIKQYEKLVIKQYEKLEYRKTHYDVHRADLTKKEHKAARQDAKEQGVTKREFKANTTRVKDGDVKDFINKNFLTEDGKVDQQALKDFVFQYIGTDFKGNYGIHKKHNGGIGQDEYRMLMDETGLSRKEVQKLIKAAGGFTEKSDKGAKMVAAAVPATALASALGSAVGSAFRATASASAHAFAEAGVWNDITEEWLAYDSSEDFANATKKLSAAGAATTASAITGAVTAIVTTATLYHYDGERDIMNGFTVEQAVHNPDLMLKGLKKPSDLDKLPFVALNLLKQSGIPEKEIVAAIQVAKGNADGNNVNIDEFMSAVKMLELKYKDKDVQDTQAKQPTIETKFEEVEVPTQTTENQEKPVETYEYKRESGEYWDGIVRNMYVDEHGKPISGDDLKKLRTDIKAQHGFKPSSSDMPPIVNLEYEVEVNGHKYKLRNDGNITRIKDTKPSDGKERQGNYTPRTVITPVTVNGVTTGYKYTITVTDADGNVTHKSESQVYKDKDACQQAAQQAEARLREQNNIK